MNERLRAYVEFSVPLSVELIPRVLLLPPAEVMTVSDKYGTHGCPIIENTFHVEITRMDRLKFEKASLSASFNGKFVSLKSLPRFDLAKKKKTPPQDLSLMSSRILIGFCWKESISRRILPREGSVFARTRAGCPPSFKSANKRELIQLITSDLQQ